MVAGALVAAVVSGGGDTMQVWRGTAWVVANGLGGFVGAGLRVLQPRPRLRSEEVIRGARGDTESAARREGVPWWVVALVIAGLSTCWAERVLEGVDYEGRAMRGMLLWTACLGCIGGGYWGHRVSSRNDSRGWDIDPSL